MRAFICIVPWKKFHASEQEPYFIPGAMGDMRNFVSSGKDLMGMGYEWSLTFLLLSYWKIAPLSTVDARNI